MSRTYARLFARPVFAKLNRVLFEFSLRGLGILNWENWSLSGEKWFLEAYLPEKLRDRAEPVFFDVGANVGRYSTTLAERFPEGSGYAFEAHPDNFERLAKALETTRFTATGQVVGSKAGSFPLYDYKDERFGSSHASFTSQVLEDCHRGEARSVEVPVISMDDFCASKGIERIDLLKIDVEGHELEVLKGAKELLRKRSVGIIQLEFNFTHIYSRVMFSDFTDLLDDYSIYRLLPNSLLPLDQASLTESHLFAFQNLVAVLND